MPLSDFNQGQSEAVIRLLTCATYGDDHLSIDELDTFQDMVDGLPWDSGTSIDIFLTQATAEARSAHEAGSEKSYMENLCAGFDSDATRATALDLLVHLLDSDGTTVGEASLIEHAKGLLA